MRNRKATFSALALTAALAVQAIAAFPASAIYDPSNPNPMVDDGMMHIMAVPTNLEIRPISAVLPTTPSAITYDGTALDLQGLSAYVSETGIVMLPLRAVMEGMGYQVNWQADTYSVEMIRGAHWVTLTPGADVYTFGKMAPMTLGVPSEIKDNRTYVPIAFFTDVLPYVATLDGEGVLAFASDAGTTAAPATEPAASQAVPEGDPSGEAVVAPQE